MSITKDMFIHKSTIKATASVIFLHGLGDSGYGWYEGFGQIKKSHVRYIFPNAPSMPVTMNGGFVMPSWYDLKGLGPKSEEDEKGIKASAAKVRAIIEKEKSDHGIPSERIMLGGFSMGGALALYTAFTHPEQLGGVIALSSYLPLHQSFIKGLDGHNLTVQRCPIFQGHGTADNMLPVNFGQLSHEVMKQRPCWS
uniref:palmitoyl-protein hydrolase n=1 Tax=Ciona savignyi TaxID=51511 RepID=H2ZKT0_CIOSA